MRFRLSVALLAVIAAGCTDDLPAPTRTTIEWPSAPSTTATAPSTTTSAPVSSSTSTAPTTTTEAPRDDLVIGVDRWPRSLNPYVDSSETVRRISQAVHRGLTEIDGDSFEVVPDLAVRVPSVANGLVVQGPDGRTTVTFEIDPDAVWADGRPVTGDDVVFTYEAIMSLEQPPFDRSAYEEIVDIAGDSASVSVTFDDPTLAFESLFPAVVPAHEVGGTDFALDWNDEPWVSAGPFHVESFGGSELVLVPNEAFPGDGPHLERLVFRWIPDPTEMLDAFGRGDVDIMRPGPNPDAVRRFGGVQGVDLSVQASVIWEHLTFQFGERNANTDSLNSESDFRRAVASALDVGALVEGYWLSDEAFTGLLDLAGFDSDAPWANRERDLDEAVRLLQGLCTRLERDCTADPPVVVLSTTSNGEARPAVAQRVRDQLAEAGIEVRLELEDSSLFFGSVLHEGTFDVGLWAWATTPGRTSVLGALSLYDPANPLLAGENGGSTGANFGRWGTPAVEGQPSIMVFGSSSVELDQGESSVIDEHTERYAEILEDLRMTADRDVFDELAREAEELLADQIVIIPLAARGHVSVVRRVEGYTPTAWIDTWNVEAWRLP